MDALDVSIAAQESRVAGWGKEMGGGREGRIRGQDVGVEKGVWM